MIISFLLSIPTYVISFLLGFISNTVPNGAEISTTFVQLLGYSIYLMGDSLFLIVVGTLTFWALVDLKTAIAKFIIWLCPFIG